MELEMSRKIVTMMESVNYYDTDNVATCQETES